MAKKVDPLKAKQARQKKIAIGGAVLLIAVLAIQVPRMMKMMGGGTSSSAPAATPTTTAPATPTPTPGTPSAPSTPGAVASPSAGGLPESDQRPAPAPGQLVSFDRFESKDPFVQQLSNDPTGASPAPTGAEASPTQQPGPSVVPSTPAPGGSPTTAPTTTQPATQPAQGSPAPAAPASAVIAVNGVSERVDAGADFPKLDPVFRLVSVTKRSVKVGIAGGTYATGAQTVTLVRAEPLTLMNTADGARYELRLVSVR